MNQHCYTDWDETVRTCQLISTPSLPTQPIKPVHTLPGPRLFLFTSSSLGSFWVSVKRGLGTGPGGGGGGECGVYHTVLGLVLGLGSGKG